MGTAVECEHYTLRQAAVHGFVDDQYFHALQLLGEGSKSTPFVLTWDTACHWAQRQRQRS